MLQRLAIAVLMLFVSFSALAQTSPCSGGTTNPLFTVMPASKGAPGYELKFEHSTSHTLTSPHVSIAGNNISVTQVPLDVPPPPAAAQATVLNCNSQTVSLGVLAPGTYDVTWSYTLPPPIPNGQPVIVEIYTFSFTLADVPALSRSSLLGLVVLLASLGVVILRR